MAGLDVESVAGPTGYDHWTVTASIALAAHLGADRVDVYGADWTNEPDFDGYRPTEMYRTLERWARERAAWSRLEQWLTARDVTVRRVA
jgi:hypothetical protein